jgi:hypothetical protein
MVYLYLPKVINLKMEDKATSCFALPVQTQATKPLLTKSLHSPFSKLALFAAACLAAFVAALPSNPGGAPSAVTNQQVCGNNETQQCCMSSFFFHTSLVLVHV